MHLVASVCVLFVKCFLLHVLVGCMWSCGNRALYTVCRCSHCIIYHTPLLLLLVLIHMCCACALLCCAVPVPCCGVCQSVVSVGASLVFLPDYFALVPECVAALQEREEALAVAEQLREQLREKQEAATKAAAALGPAAEADKRMATMTAAVHALQVCAELLCA